MKALGTSERLGVARYVSQQIYYTLLHREAEYELVPLSIDEGIGIIVWSPLAGGLLTGKYRRDGTVPNDARHTTDWTEPPIYDMSRMFDILETLADVAREHGHSSAQTALAYILGKPGVTSVVIGARTGEQLADNLASATWTLDPASRARLDEISAVPLIYPYWHQAKSAGDRLSPGDLTLLGGRLP
jgi:aryl-alcohol dehydrogenase-like predicted oxidoreductase